MRVKLSVLVAPLAPRGPINSLIPGPVWNTPQENRQKFVHFTDGETTIGQLWTQIEEAYKNKYLTQSDFGQFAIKKLQDEHDNDLDIHYTVGELFDGEQGERIIKVIQTYVDRECSIPVTSTLRPAHLSAFKRPPLPPVPLFTSNKRRKIQSEENSSLYNGVHADRPVRSRERSVEEDDDKIESIQESKIPSRLHGQSFQSASSLREQEISDSEEERERDRENARMNNTQLRNTNSTSRQNSSLRQDSMQQSLGLHNAGYQNETAEVSISNDDQTSSEDEHSLEISEVEHRSSPELEAPPNGHDNAQNIYLNPAIPYASSHSSVPRIGSLSKSPKQSQSPQLLRSVLFSETLSNHRSSPQKRGNGPGRNDSEDGILNEDEDRTKVHSEPLTNGNSAQNSPILVQKNFYVQHSQANDENSTPKVSLPKTMWSAARSAHTSVSHVDSPVHKVLDSQNVPVTTTTRKLRDALQAGRTVNQGQDRPLQRSTLDVPKASTTLSNEIEVHESEHFSTCGTVVIGEDNLDQDMCESSQLLSTSPAVMRQLKRRDDKRLAENLQRTINSISHSRENRTASESSADQSSHHPNNSLTEDTQQVSTGKNALDSASHATQSRKFDTNPLIITSPQQQQYFDDEGNDHSSPMRRVKSLSNNPISKQKNELKRKLRRSAGVERHINDQVSEDQNNQIRGYFRHEDERNRLMRSGQIPEVWKSLSVVQTEHVPERERTAAEHSTIVEQTTAKNMKIPTALRAKSNAKLNSTKIDQTETAQQTSAQKQQAQLRERNRAMAEKELRNGGVLDAEMSNNEPPRVETNPQMQDNRSKNNSNNVPTSKSLRRPSRGITPVQKADQRNGESTSTGGLTVRSVEALRRSAGLDAPPRASSISGDEQGNMTRAVSKLKNQEVVVVIDSPAELRRARQYNKGSAKQAQSEGPAHKSPPESVPRINKFTPLNVTKELGNLSAARTNQSVDSDSAEANHEQSPEVVADDYRAAAGPSNASEKSKQFSLQAPDVPVRVTRQTTKKTGLNTNIDTHLEIGKIKTRISKVTTTTNQLKKEKGKALSKSSSDLIRNGAQKVVIEVPDDEIDADVQQPALEQQDVGKGSLRSLSQKETAPKMKPIASFTGSRTQATRSSSKSSSESSVSRDQSKALPENEVEVTSEKVLIDSSPSPEVLHGDNDRAPAKYIPSSASQSPVHDEVESDSSTHSSIVADAELPATRSSRSSSAMSGSAAESDLQTDNEASPVSTPSEQPSSLSTDLDAALQRDAERSAVPSSSLSRVQVDTHHTLSSQRTTPPPRAGRNESPDWATPKHLQTRKDTMTYNSASMKDHVANKSRELPTLATAYGKAMEELSESSEEPSSIESDSDDSDDSEVDDADNNALTASRNTPSTTHANSSRKNLPHNAAMSQHDDLLPVSEKAKSTQSNSRTPAKSTNTPIAKPAAAPKPKATPTKTPVPALRRTTSGLSLPKPSITAATKSTTHAASLSSSSDSSSSDDDDDSSHSSDDDSETERNIASKVANIPEGTMKEKAIKKMRRLAKFTRKVDRDLAGGKRKVGAVGVYQQVGGTGRF